MKGLTFVQMLTIIFVVLKVFKIITWSWWLVFSPLWISLAIGAGLMVLAFLPSQGLDVVLTVDWSNPTGVEVSSKRDWL